MARAPDTYAKYEADWRDTDVTAMMALIDQLEELNRNLARLED